MKSYNLYKTLLILWISCPLLGFGQKNSSLTIAGYTNTDTLFNKPYIDIDEWRDKPIHHHYVHGGFKGTDTRFSYYFPLKEDYRGHFFQYITPVPDNENISQTHTGEEDKISFSVSHGAYYVETNGGGLSVTGRIGSSVDPTIGAYRANAACAQFSRTVAAQLYGKHKTYGYSFGGSGGAYRTIGGIENTDGVWDGAVPFVVGSPMALPNVFTVRVYAMQVLHDKFPQIVDALEPGGSGDMYAGLNNEQKAALKEVTQMGFPPKAWFAWKTMGLHAFPVIYPGVMMADSKYFKDFWTVPGYLGANPPAYLTKARIQQSSKIKVLLNATQAANFGLANTTGTAEERGTANAAWKGIGGQNGALPIAVQLDNYITDDYFLGGNLVIKTGEAAGKRLFITNVKADKVVFGNDDVKILAQLKPGDEVMVDNSNFLAAETYHRHQVPGKEYKVWDQFRDSTGKPVYPQRPLILGPLFTKGASGILPIGKFNGKMILLESLWDSEAFPWQADWYRSRVKENLGDSLDNHFRLWFTDHANHGDSKDSGNPDQLVSYLGVLQQALLDLSDWVEKGISPPASTNYNIVNGQVVVPLNARERLGIQPTVAIKVNGGERAFVKAGKPVNFMARIELPPNSGKIISADWDFEGSGVFSIKEKLSKSKLAESFAEIKASHTFLKPGVYFPTLLVASQRAGDEETQFTRIKNLGRVRVIVE